MQVFKDILGDAMAENNKTKILKKDITIPAGTVFTKAPIVTRRHGDEHFDCVVGLTDNSFGFFNYCIDADDPGLNEFFEDGE